MTAGIILAGGDLTPEFAEKIIEEYSSRGEVFLAAADAGLEICDRAGRHREAGGASGLPGPGRTFPGAA